MSNSSTQPPTWLITGTSNGLGLSLSQYILSQGHNLISLSRHENPDPSLTTKRPNSTLHHIPLDLSDPNPTTTKSAISNFLTSNPTIHIDILVNNAGITIPDAVENTSPTNLNTVMTTNFFSPVYLIQSLLPQMRASSSSSAKDGSGYPQVIVNISSTQGLCADPSELAYDASKHALEAMSGVLASEVSLFGIRVMVVELGSLRTKFAGAGETKRQKPNQTQTHGGEQQDTNDPYSDPTHPVVKRMAGVKRYIEEPWLAKGDPMKTAAILFDAVMRTEGSVVDEILEMQRKKTTEEGGNARVERLVLGSDAQPKIERVLERLRFDVESCRGVSGLIEADSE